MVWVLVLGGALLLWLSPLIVAALRDAEQIGLVVLFMGLGLGTGVFWFAAWVPALGPRRYRYRPARGWRGPGTCQHCGAWRG